MVDYGDSAVLGSDTDEGRLRRPFDYHTSTLTVCGTWSESNEQLVICCLAEKDIHKQVSFDRKQKRESTICLEPSIHPSISATSRSKRLSCTGTERVLATLGYYKKDSTPAFHFSVVSLYSQWLAQ